MANYKALILAVGIAMPMEGLRTKAYRDPGPAIWTVCYGHTIGVTESTTYTPEECKKLLMLEMEDAIRSVERCQPGLPDPVLAAFSSAVYNLGPRIVCDSTASKYLKARNYTAACNELPRWDGSRVGGIMVRLPGLTKRRMMEKDLCLTYLQSH